MACPPLYSASPFPTDSTPTNKMVDEAAMPCASSRGFSWEIDAHKTRNSNLDIAATTASPTSEARSDPEEMEVKLFFVDDNDPTTSWQWRHLKHPASANFQHGLAEKAPAVPAKDPPRQSALASPSPQSYRPVSQTRTSVPPPKSIPSVQCPPVAGRYSTVAPYPPPFRHDEKPHLPGQIPPPPQSRQRQWQRHILRPTRNCLYALTCPCVLYSRTAHRLDARSKHVDQAQTQAQSGVNLTCAFFAMACGLQCLLASLHRARIRSLHRIDGSLARDCALGCVCLPCVLAQNETEVCARDNSLSPAAGYISIPVDMGMVYAASSG